MDGNLEATGGSTTWGPPVGGMAWIVSGDSTMNSSLSMSQIEDKQREKQKINATLTEAAKEIFRYKPFIVFDNELGVDKEMAKKFFKLFGEDLDADREAQMWVDEGCRELLRGKHKKRRNNVQTKIKKKMESKLKCCCCDVGFGLAANRKLTPFVKELLQNKLETSKDPEEQEKMNKRTKWREINVDNIRGKDDYGNYKYFMDEFGPAIIGVDDYKKFRDEKSPDEWMTIAEESFVLVSLENYGELVEQQVRYNSKVKPMYTENGKAKRNQGYTKAGIDKFNEIFEKVVENRKDKTFGERYLKEKKEEVRKGKASKEESWLAKATKRENGWTGAKCLAIPI